jgi:hypothetical protein
MTVALHILQFRPVRWIIAITWTIFISIVLVQPENQPLINTGIPPGPNTLERELVFTTLHLIAFSTTCAVWFWAWFGHLILKHSLLIAISIALTLGGVTEYLQSFSPDRYPSVGDLLANASGALLMARFIWSRQQAIHQLNHQ